MSGVGWRVRLGGRSRGRGEASRVEGMVAEARSQSEQIFLRIISLVDTEKDIFQLKEVSLRDFEKKVEKWLTDDKSFRESFFDYLRYLWFNKLPKGFSVSSVTHWLLKLAIFISGPTISFAVYGKISFNQAVLAIGALAFLYCVSWFFDRRSAKAKSEGYASTEALWVQFGDLIDSVKSEATLKANKDKSVRASLGIIQNYAQSITKSSKAEVSVTVALYKGSGREKMTIFARNPDSDRPLGRTIHDLDYVLGHRACLYGNHPRVVGDLKKFGKYAFKSPTQAKCSYRSILLVPLTSERGENREMQGFMSVDCVRPHAFHGSNADEILMTCEPFISHIKQQL